MGDFERDNEWQRKVRDSVLAPGFYGPYALEGRYVFIDKGRLATTLQKRYAVDTVLQGRNGAAFCIEEKIVRWPGRRYSAYALETESCTKPGRESQGWMRYGKADYLLYGFMRPDRLVVHLIDFPKLQDWFWKRVDSFPKFGPLPTFNASAGRKVPLADVEANVLVRVRTIHPDPSDPLYPELFGITDSADAKRGGPPMRMQPSPHALDRNTKAAEYSVTGWQAGKTENSLMNASHAGKPSVGAFSGEQDLITSGAKCV